MPDRPFERLRTALLDRGFSNPYVERLVAELNDHYEDLAADRRNAGLQPENAALLARQLLGSDPFLVAQVMRRPELSDRWAGLRAAWRIRRRDWTAEEAVLGSALVAPALARWSLSIAFGALLTSVLLLTMAHAITFGA
jgi:hypothetical protein